MKREVSNDNTRQSSQKQIGQFFHVGRDDVRIGNVGTVGHRGLDSHAVTDSLNQYFPDSRWLSSALASSRRRGFLLNRPFRHRSMFILPIEPVAPRL
jgi:hypothetical protein